MCLADPQSNARSVARNKVLTALRTGPRTPAELRAWHLKDTPYEPAARRDELLAELVAEGLVVPTTPLAGYKLRPTLTYRLASKVEADR